MKILIFVSVLGMLASVAVLIAVIMKSNRDRGGPPDGKQG